MQIKAPKDYGFVPEQAEIDGSGWQDIADTLPFSLEAEDFINFATLDMKGKSNKDLVNALSNIKRAIENRMDGVLFVFKYQELIRELNFPDKVKKLGKMGIISPRILKKINRIRNLLEHEYRIPKRQEVEDAFDVAILFLAYTRNFIKRNVTDYTCHLNKEGKPKTYLSVSFDDKGLVVEMGKNEFHVDASNPAYDEWIKFTIKLCY